MSPAERTWWFVKSTVALWIVWDVWTLQRYGVESTISRVILDKSLAGNLAIPFAIGLLCGHLVLSQLR